MNRDLIEAIRISFGDKETLLKFLGEHFEFHIPVDSTYPKIIELKASKRKEHDFCHKVFGAENFQEVAASYEIMQGLGILSTEELIKIADRLSEQQKKWKYGKTTRKVLVTSLLQNVKKSELDACLEELIGKKEMEPIRQYMDWVIGPLGISRSICKRKPMESADLIRLLTKHVDRVIYPDFHRMAEYVPADIIPANDDQLLLPKFFQLLLTYANNEMIFDTMNRLIESNKVRIETIEQYWNIIVAPCGVFNRRYRGVEQLAEILSNEFEEPELVILLGERGFASAATKLRVLERCIKERPDDILDELFGIIDLWRIAKGIGLVSPEKIKDKKELIKIILVRLGFSLPPQLGGLAAYQKNLQNYLRRLENFQVDPQEKTGIMTEVYAKTESILKDVIYFYISFLWNEKIEQFYELEEKKEAADNIIRKEFNVQKNVDEMNLGPLINLLRQIDSRLQKNHTIREHLEKEFGRTSLILKEQFEILNKVSPFRPLFGHDVKVEGKRKEVDLQTCKEIVSSLIMLAKDLENNGIYPNLIRITREVTDEYGTTYLEVIDEKEGKWILARSWLQPNFAYFMHTKAKPIAIHPFTVVKFW